MNDDSGPTIPCPWKLNIIPKMIKITPTTMNDNEPMKSFDSFKIKMRWNPICRILNLMLFEFYLGYL